jgi:hypothetical protein
MFVPAQPSQLASGPPSSPPVRLDDAAARPMLDRAFHRIAIACQDRAPHRFPGAAAEIIASRRRDVHARG